MKLDEGALVNQLDQIRGSRPIKPQPAPNHDLRERESRLRHALEVIRDAEGLDAKALQTIAYAVIGPRISLEEPRD